MNTDKRSLPAMGAPLRSILSSVFIRVHQWLFPRCSMALRVYNTLTRQKEPFKTVQPGRVGMYVCGPTVYKPSHVGHMVGPVIFDTVKRYLVYSGYQVRLVVNITDVDAKLIVQAQKQNTTVAEL